MNAGERTVVGRWEGLAATEMVWAVAHDGGRIVVEIDTADPLSAAPRPCVPAARVRATPDQLRDMFRLAARVLEVVERMEVEAAGGAGPGWPGLCPPGVAWERWLASNNVD
jgi:hypothetical protein